ncbi:MAG TPA: OmpA family protein [Candidatus Eisenbacteria bacterium]|nr:OmpA family protein [Candidatus Eisenbacteria bacterium]
MARRMDSVAGSVLALALVGVGLTGCATKGFVRQQVAESKAYTDTKTGEVSGRVDQVGTRADQANALAERLAAGQYTEVATHQVQFEFDDYKLGSAAGSTLDQIGSVLASHPRYALEVRGYADAKGTDRYNYKLGRERAEEVVRYMMAHHNVPMSRIAMVSFGEESPVADNSSTDGRAQNRRVQVRVLELNTNPPTAAMPTP